MVKGVIDLVRREPPVGYQPRSSTVQVAQGKRQRHCRACSSIIPTKCKHVVIDAHLSSGYISNINLCKECIIKFAKELKNV